MITLEHLCERVSNGVLSSAVIVDEDLDKVAQQVFAALISNRDLYFYDSAADVSYTPEPCTPQEVKNRILSSTSILHFQTSGTTGLPKRISHDVKALLDGVRTTTSLDGATWGFAYSCRHISGILVMLQAWMTNARLVDLRNCSKTRFSDIVTKTGVSHLSAPSTYYRMLLPLAQPCKSLSNVTNGGEPLDDTIIAHIRSSFPNAVVRNVYASTEVGSLLVSKSSLFSIPERLVGMVRIEDDTLRVHRCCVSPSVSFEGDWYDTGDKVVRVSDGSFAIIGRTSEQVKVLGHLVSIRKVEEAINGLTGVKISRVVARPHTVFGSLLSAEVVLVEHVAMTKKEIKAALSQELRDYEVPTRINVVEAIETTYTGKIARTPS